MKQPLEKILKRFGLQRKVKEQRALQVWGQAAGGKLAESTRPLAVKEGILFVQVANSSWAQHLTFFKPNLLWKLNRLLGGPVITDIHFQVGFLKPGAPAPAVEAAATLSTADREKIREMFAEFQGQDIMKEKLMELMEKELLSRRQKEAAGWQPCSRCGSPAPPDALLCPLCQIQGR
jgi:hypothetical protein